MFPAQDEEAYHIVAKMIPQSVVRDRLVLLLMQEGIGQGLGEPRSRYRTTME